MSEQLTEIIVVKYKAPELEQKCLQSVIKYTKIPYHLTVYDNGPQNYNLGQLWNRLIARSDARYICLLNSDTIVSDEWLGKLVVALQERPDAGAVGPTTNYSRNQQSSEAVSSSKVVVNFSKLYPGWCLSGFCLVFPKTIWEIAGKFPQDCGFYGQEVLFLDKVQARGYVQLWRKDVFVRHVGEGSIKGAQRRGEIDISEERRKARTRVNNARQD